MKKLFTLLAIAAVALSANAQEITVTSSGTFSSDGNTLLFNEPDPTLLDLGMVQLGGKIYLLSPEDCTVTATLSVAADAPGEIEFCTNMCTVVYPGQTSSNDVELEFDMEKFFTIDVTWYDSTEIRTYNSTLTLKSDLGYERSFAVVLTNDPDYASVTKVATEGIRFCGNTLNWNLASAPGELNLFTTDGRKAATYSLNSAAGSLEIALAPGLYIWNVAGKSGKIAVR